MKQRLKILYPEWCYTFFRLVLGGWFFIHGVGNIISYDSYFQLIYVYYEKSIVFDILLTITPFLEFLTSLFLLIGMYTRITLWNTLVAMLIHILFYLYSKNYGLIGWHFFLFIITILLLKYRKYNSLSADAKFEGGF
ncbi:DoxX family membrane protein [Imtechella halotolerans]|uniref:DoxX family protein n=1 Tax=Imtechella halotolerans K1 TaxID=946077 RepID=I0WGT1_9FLAO|nr:DoxX family membrane protein [Imtechella halotolerans]EID75597.1 DoxX family protein [Imtechella halotolerans K1]WMQ63575.1 DoxX family membrane protein [Imtechella halotolerans]